MNLDPSRQFYLSQRYSLEYYCKQLIDLFVKFNKKQGDCLPLRHLIKIYHLHLAERKKNCDPRLKDCIVSYISYDILRARDNLVNYNKLFSIFDNKVYVLVDNFRDFKIPPYNSTKPC